MSTRLAEERIFNKKNYPLLYLVKDREDNRTGKIIQSRSGVFYVMIIIVIFFSMGILLNIGLKIQAINHESRIIEVNEMISIEKERSDRLSLQISELKSPSRIAETAENKLGMNISDGIRIMKIGTGSIIHVDKVDDYIAKNPSSGIKNYDSFLGTIYSIKDIIMVVSEGVLTFFIP